MPARAFIPPPEQGAGGNGRRSEFPPGSKEAAVPFFNPESSANFGGNPEEVRAYDLR